MDQFFILIIIMIICLSLKEPAMLISHILNIILRLPHPGPNDIQGSCWCRRHEGPHKYTFRDYFKHIMGG